MDNLRAGLIFAFPALVIEPHLEELWRQGITYKRRLVRVDSYELDAYIFRARNDIEAAEMFFSIAGTVGGMSASNVISAKWGNREVPYFVIKTGTVRIIPRSGEAEDKKRIEELPYPRIRNILENFSRLSGGLDIDFYAEDRSVARPPLPDIANLINIFPFNHPPGYSKSEYICHVFDLPVDAKEGAGVLTFSGTPGRGEFVGDGKNDFVQMLGSNWYLMFPVVEFYNVLTSSKILEHILATTLRRYQALRRGARPSDRNVRLTRQKFVGVATKWINSIGGTIEKEIRKLKKEIEGLRLSLAIKERTCFDLERLCRAVDNTLSEDKLVISLKGEWHRIQSNPRISGLSLVENVINVTTVGVDICHGGQSRQLGRFVIGIHKNGEFYIWSLDRLHPEGIPHPHISREGTPCFGNADSAIKDAMKEHRYADGVGYIVCWLFDGYEDKTAAHKITEWPILAISAKEEKSCDGE